MRIVGLDIHPGRDAFSVAVLDGGLRVFSVSMSSLLKELERLRPEIIAIDDESEFSGILERIAETTGATIVRAGRRGKKLYEVAKEAGIWTGGHPSPNQAAILAAKLASLGIYEVVMSGVKETVIKISPERASFRGGREAKYKRSLRVFIEHAKREVERRLKESGIEFDEFTRGASYEIRAYENVYRVRDVLRGVDVQDVRLDVQASKPIRSRLRGKFIVGVDPGTHVGLAFLNIYGDLVHSSTLEGGRERVISYIRSIGEPLLIAIDVPEIPDFVKRISAALRAPIYVPDAPITLEEKRLIAAEYGLKGSSHERDALAAAVKAYYKYKAKIDRSIRAAREFGLDPNEVVYLVLRNHSVMGAISKLMPKPKEEPKKPKRERSKEELERELEALRRELDRLKKAYKWALEELESYKLELEMARSEERKELLKEFTISSLKERVKSLEGEVERLRAELEKSDEIIGELSKIAPETLERFSIGKYLKDLTWKSVSSLKPASIEKGDVIFVEKPRRDEKGLKEVLKASHILAPKSLVKELSRVLDRRVIPREYVKWKRLGPLVLYDRTTLQEAIKRVDEEEQKIVGEVIKNIIFELSRRASFRERARPF